MDAIFKALADPARRSLLDSLAAKDGQTLKELEAQLDMTRFGVMKHLKVLEEAGLVIPRRSGRFKHHFLNAAPLEEAIDRWIAPYRPAAKATLTLKHRLETPMTDKPDFVMQTYIRCTREALWDALTDADQMAEYHFLARKVTEEDKIYRYYFEGGEPMFTARTLEADPKSRIVSTFEPHWEEDAVVSKSTFLIDEEGEYCRLTIEHRDLKYPVAYGEGVADGWNRWAAGLKTFLETGQSVRFSAEAQKEDEPA